jgi:hypothetical protein
MLGTKDFFELAQLAEASYAEFSLFAANKSKDALVADGFSNKQADLFLADWQLVSGGHRPNTASGFSSTLFKSTDPDGSYVLAFRGTEPDSLESILQDAGDIAFDGIALDQIVDLYNEWKRITSNGVYLAAKLVVLDSETSMLQESMQEWTAYDANPFGPMPGVAQPETLMDGWSSRADIIIDMPSGTVSTIRFESSATVFSDVRQTGLGLDIDPGKLTVTGHSSGGHLAVAFTRLFPEMSAQALTINGAGFATGEISVPGLGLFATTNIRNLFGMLGGATGFESADILNLYGDRYPEIITQNGSMEKQGQVLH